MDDSVNLASVHKNRRAAEHDAQMLANRIRLLECEEMRTHRKIEETRERARQLMKIYQEQEDIRRLYQQVKDSRRKDLNALRARNRKFREAMKLSKEDIENSIRQAKRESAQLVRQESKANTFKRGKYFSKFHQANNRRALEVKHSHQQTRSRLQLYQDSRLDQARAGYLARIQEENRLKRKKEQDIVKMESIEASLIRRLQDTQQVQKQL